MNNDMLKYNDTYALRLPYFTSLQPVNTYCSLYVPIEHHTRRCIGWSTVGYSALAHYLICLFYKRTITVKHTFSEQKLLMTECSAHMNLVY